MSEFLEGLNKEQLEAVTHGKGPLLVLAGAGTGKTEVLTRRIGHLVQQGADPTEILALTLSSRAASKMRERAEALINRSYEELAVSTFHAFCARLLRSEALTAGIDPFFEAMSPADRVTLLLDHLGEVGLSELKTRGNPTGLISRFIKQIDRCKEEAVDASTYRAWAEARLSEVTNDSERSEAKRHAEFAAVFSAHDRLVESAGGMDFGELILSCLRLLEQHEDARKRLVTRYQWILVDEYQDLSFAQTRLVRLITAKPDNITVAADDDQSIYRFRGAGRKNILDFQETFPQARQIRLVLSFRCGEPIVDAAKAVIEPISDRFEKNLSGSGNARVRFWRCQNERAQAQATASEVERLIAGGAEPQSICILTHSVRYEGEPIAGALQERSIPFRQTGAGAFFSRTEVRDLLAWLRLLADPADSDAVVRALTRPPVQLRSVDLARISQIARRRKSYLVSAVAAGLEHPQIPPPARDRLNLFLEIQKLLQDAYSTLKPDTFVQRLVELVGLRKQQLFAADEETIKRLANIGKLHGLAARYLRRKPNATPRDFALHLRTITEADLREEEEAPETSKGAVQVMTMHTAKGRKFDHVFVLGLTKSRLPGTYNHSDGPVPEALLHEELPADSTKSHSAEMRRLLYVAMTRASRGLVLAWPEVSGEEAEQKPSPFLVEAQEATGGEEEVFAEEPFGPSESLHSAFRMVRDELFDTVARVGGRLGELRLDTYMDVNHAMVRFLELLKLAALINRDTSQPLPDTLSQVNQLLLQAATGEQREIFLSSSLDEYVLASERKEQLRRKAIDSKLEPSLEAFLPTRGGSLDLSATDIWMYRTCPARYKFTRVFALPREPTVQQRFGILMHQVLERYHTAQAENGTGLEILLDLFNRGWRRAGFGNSSGDLEYRRKGIEALKLYQAQFERDTAVPVWLERNFSFTIGPHRLRGRVDRVDRLPDGGYELIDYKTGRPKTADELTDDVQLSLYQLGAREAWKLEPTAQSYYYLLDNQKVPVSRSEKELDAVRDLAMEVGDSILAQSFEPKPSSRICGWCDFKLICPAAET